ncbi:MAG TPA: 5-amino-6-(D-ribitylamino)uracil--L-tyrosine 4-hydroxyphenyl transferase CofH [Casimicrobiaceae bacterium]|nr:5-amino-6-(D-ribitylamino)uracil--L-tyrosine 4-hydroxyphenyl transferase CofH [Casimicrobiaceae bacterium]
MTASAAESVGDARREEARRWLTTTGTLPLESLLERAHASARAAHGAVITYSRKVFIPLTRLCRDVCAYCTFATTPSRVASPFLSPDEVLELARRGRAAGCDEALFTLGDKPELRYESARDALARLGYARTIDYLAAMCDAVRRDTGLLPHVNAGVMEEADIARLRSVSVSQGLMLESAADRLMGPGHAHHGSPDKAPAARIAMIEAAGRLAVPFTSGILFGIGETRQERIEALLVLRDLHARYGHLQEVIIQNFRAKPGTRMAQASEPDLDDVLWTAAAARDILGGAMNLQVPPNLSFAQFPRLLAAGINDWGGISPVTADHVNPEARWPAIATLRAATEAHGLALAERLAIYPAYARAAARWVDPNLRPALLASSDAEGLARADAWSPGIHAPVPPEHTRPAPLRAASALDPLLRRAMQGEPLDAAEIETLFRARGSGVSEIVAAADALRAQVSGDVVRYVVNRNINYTNVCAYSCRFCAFSKGRAHEQLRGPAYDLALEEVARRVGEARERGATEVCMQGGIHPHYTGETYVALLRAAKEAVPQIHVHAFSPLEIGHGAQTLGVSITAFLARLQAAGLGSLPGTAAEILDDEVRARICKDKVDTRSWLDVIEAAHTVGLRTTATIMFGHVETPSSWARHLIHVRDLQRRTGGFTEFVPLPFVHMEAPMYLRGEARKGPTWRETRLMHAVARLSLHPLIPNIQASWVKAGADGASRLLGAGANDLGGTLMNESISRAAGTQHGQEMPPLAMEQLIGASGRIPRQRTTLYGDVPEHLQRTSRAAMPLAPLVMTPVARRPMRTLAT